MKLSSDSSTNQEGILARNTLINMGGKVLPLFFAVAAIPFVIRGLGTERFGVLTIIWTVIGYFGLFDMGLGRAVTKFVADQEARNEQLSPLIITAVLLLIGFGIIGGLLIFLATPFLVYHLLHIPGPLAAETQKAFYILSASIPIVLATIGVRGILEAQQRFGLVNAVKVPATIFNYIGPLLVLLFSNHLQYIVLLLVIERVISFIIYLYYSFRDQPFIKVSISSFLQWTKRLLGFGAWLTVSKFVSPVMVYMDRFFIGAILTMSAVAYYTTPYEVVSRIAIISGSFMGVMFPAFSVYFLQNSSKLTTVYQKSVRYVLFVLIPIVTFLIFAAHPLLYYWLGSEFAQHSTAVFQLLTAGIFINSVARISSTVIQAGGRPDITAKLHLVELPLYLVLLWFLIHRLGIRGVAVAWLFRVSLDCGLLFYFSNRITFFKIGWRPLLIRAGSTIAIICAGMIALWWIDNTFVTLVYATWWGLATLYITWKYILKDAERVRISGLITDMRMKVNGGIRRDLL